MMLLLGVLASLSLPGSHSWTYRGGRQGPAKWAGLPGTLCSGGHQSPIDLNLTTATPSGARDMGQIFVKGKVPSLSLLTNNGHSAQLDIPASKEFRFDFSHLDTTFHLLQLHFHWGHNSLLGSEHTLERHHFPMEMHLVHSDKASNKAVLAFFFKVHKDHNSFLEPIMDALALVKAEALSESLQEAGHRAHGARSMEHLLQGAGHRDQPFDLKALIHTSLQQSFFTYTGSLTTPPCSEKVLWLVFTAPILLSEDQLQKYRDLRSTAEGGPLEDNFRPVQPLNGRTVTYTSRARRSASRFVNGHSYQLIKL